MRKMQKISSERAASIAGRILAGGSFSTVDIAMLAASVLAQRPAARAKKKPAKRAVKRARK